MRLEVTEFNIIMWSFNPMICHAEQKLRWQRWTYFLDATFSPGADFKFFLLERRWNKYTNEEQDVCLSEVWTHRTHQIAYIGLWEFVKLRNVQTLVLKRSPHAHHYHHSSSFLRSFRVPACTACGYFVGTSTSALPLNAVLSFRCCIASKL